jgi:DNA primase small subunit
MSSKGFIKGQFRHYYQKDFALDDNFIPEIEKREFGFNLFEGWMLRHKSFKNNEDLKTFIGTCVPSDVYYSCAYYYNPEAEMDKKEWLGADLIFDIDADHIQTACDKIHDVWTCESCGFMGRGITPEKCPICNGEKFNTATWPCEKCLASAKAETIKLLDILMHDFGFSKKDIRVFFSGHRGYHIHIENENIKSLDTMARKEIVDYMTGLGLDITLNSNRRKVEVQFGAHSNTCRWINRIKDEASKLVLWATKEDLKNIGLKESVVRAIIQNRETLSNNLRTGTFKGIRGVGVQTIEKLIAHAVEKCSVKIDTVVTTDTHRLIRLPQTLNSKTGFKKIGFLPSEIDTFDPFKEAVAFKEGAVTLFISSAPEFRIKDETYGPYKNQKVTLPTAAAILLLCKGKAEVIESE